MKKHNVYKLCDLGCGFGNFLIHAKASFPQVCGVDPGTESLKIAKQLVPHADLRMGNGEEMPFEDDVLDAVVMKGVVHHLKDPNLVFREVYRCLKLGGILLIFEGNRSSCYRRIVLGIADFLKINHETTLFEHRSPKVMKEMLEKEGFKINECKNISGLFTPLALTGFGGLRIWKFLIAIEDILQRRCPFLFNYHVMLTAKKQLPVQTRR